MDDRQFDELSRRVAGWAASRLPRRSALIAAGATALGAGLALDDALGKKKNKNKNNKKKCKNEGQGCDKQKCKKQNKKCCCNDLNCVDGICEGKNGSCPTNVSFNFAWSSFTPNSGPSSFSTPFGIATDSDGTLYVSDTNNERILLFNQSGTFTGQFGTIGTENDQFETPFGLGVNVNSSGNRRVIVADPGQPSSDHKLRQFRTTGQFEGHLGVSSLDNPRGVGIDDDDRIWVVDATGTGQVFRYNQNGGTSPTIFDPSGSGSLASPQGIALFRDKNSNNDLFVYVADTGNQRVIKFRYVNDNNSGLEFVTSAGEAGAGSKNFNQPTGIAVDACGNVYVADRINNRIQQLDKDLNFKSSITSSLSRPTGVVVLPNGNQLYIVDSENNRIVCLTLSK